MKLRPGDTVCRRGSIPNRIRGYTEYTVIDANDRQLCIECDDGVVRWYDRGKWELWRRVWKEKVGWLLLWTYEGLRQPNMNIFDTQEIAQQNINAVLAMAGGKVLASKKITIPYKEG